MPRLALLPVVLAVALAGCGGGGDSAADFEGEQKAVAQVVEDLQEASVEDEPRRICRALLDPALVRRAGGPDACARRIDAALGDADTYELEVKAVRITGATATARVESGRQGNQVETIRLVRVGRAWRIAALGAR